MTHTLTLPVRRDLLQTDSAGRTSWRLARGQVVGTYDGRDLTKRVRSDRHAYRARPGIAWNLELLALAERFRPQPRTLAVAVDDGRVLRVPFRVALRYARAAQDGDVRYRVADDVDVQVLIPWDVWEGVQDGPPPVQETLL